MAISIATQKNNIFIARHKRAYSKIINPTLLLIRELNVVNQCYFV